MLDTSGIAGSLPLTSLALDHALLDFNLQTAALDRIGFYFETFIYANGSIDMGHWKDPWKDSGAGQYNCTFPDSLADHGRMLELFTRAVRLTNNLTWYDKHKPAAERVVTYLLKSLNESQAHNPDQSSLTYDFIFGPAEHDTCTDPEFYFSVQAWNWRGLLEYNRLLQDIGNPQSATLSSKISAATVTMLSDDRSGSRAIGTSIAAAG